METHRPAGAGVDLLIDRFDEVGVVEAPVRCGVDIYACRECMLCGVMEEERLLKDTIGQ